MHDAWHILSWLWFAVLVAYGVLQVYAAKRLQNVDKRRSRDIFIVMAVLFAFRVGADSVLRSRDVHRLGTVVVGMAAGIAALVLAKMLVEQKQSDEAPTATTTGSSR